MPRKAKVKGWADPAQGYATYRVIRSWIMTLWIAAFLSLGIFALLWLQTPAHAWLLATVAEGLVVTTFFLFACPVLVALVYWYMGRILKARLVDSGLPLPAKPAATPANYTLYHWLVSLGLIALCAALLWVEYAYQGSVTERRNNPTTLDRAIFGNVSPSFAGLVGFVIIATFTFVVRGMWERRNV